MKKQTYVLTAKNCHQLIELYSFADKGIVKIVMFLTSLTLACLFSQVMVLLIGTLPVNNFSFKGNNTPGIHCMTETGYLYKYFLKETLHVNSFILGKTADLRKNSLKMTVQTSLLVFHIITFHFGLFSFLVSAGLSPYS